MTAQETVSCMFVARGDTTVGCRLYGSCEMDEEQSGTPHHTTKA